MTRRTALEMLCVGLGSVQIASIDPETKIQGSAWLQYDLNDFKALRVLYHGETLEISIDEMWRALKSEPPKEPPYDHD